MPDRRDNLRIRGAVRQCFEGQWMATANVTTAASGLTMCEMQGAIAFLVMQESRPNRGRPLAMHSAMLKLWFEEVCECLGLGHSNSGDIVPPRCSSQMSIRAEGDERHGALVQGYIPKRVVERRSSL